MKLIFSIFIVCNVFAADNVELLTMKFYSKASYEIEQIPYQKIAFTGIRGDQLKKIDNWIYEKLSTISELELIRTDIDKPVVNSLLNIQEHNVDGLKKLKKLLGVQALLQGKLELHVRDDLEVHFKLHLYDLETGINIHAISRNWTIPVKSRSRQVLYEAAVIKVLEEINQEWYSYLKTEEVSWYKDSHKAARKVIDLIKLKSWSEAFNLMLTDKRNSEMQLFKRQNSKRAKDQYQLILYHIGLLHELQGRFKVARQFYDLAIKHGVHSETGVFLKAKRRVKKRW